MRIPGERIKRTRLIQSDKYVVEVEVEMVVPVDAPSEPCYESETVQLLQGSQGACRARRRGLVDQEGQGLRGDGGCVNTQGGI